jgi:hypothetical protein
MLLRVDLTCWHVRPTCCAVCRQRPPPSQPLFFEFFLLFNVTVFLFLFYVGLLVGYHPSTDPFRLSAVTLQQLFYSSCFFTATDSSSSLFALITVWRGPGIGPAFNCHCLPSGSLNQIQILLFYCIYFLGLLVGVPTLLIQSCNPLLSPPSEGVCCVLCS